MRSLWCVLAALLLAAAVVPAETILESEGALEADDAVLEDGRHVDWTRANLVAGTRYLFSASSDEIDTSLLLRFPDGALLASEDVDGWNPVLLYSAARSETVEVGVSTSTEPSSGAYLLRVLSLPAARAVQAGQKTTQLLHDRSAAEAEGGSRRKIDSALLSGARGERVLVRLASSDFDAYLRLQSRDGYVAERDDSGDTTDAELPYVFTQRGQVEVVVRATDTSQGGEYTLSVERQGTAPSLEAGRPASGNLKSAREQYLLEGRKGQAVLIEARSEDFDPVLEVVDRAGRRAVNDDWGDGTDSRLHYLFAEDGAVAITVSGQDEEDTGAFTLSAAAAPFRSGEFATAGRRLDGDGEIAGYLAAGTTRRNGHYAHRYTFSADAFELVRFQMSSEDLDSRLELVGPEGYVAEDDDSLGGYDALLEAACPVAGEYSLYASTSGEWETGFYRLGFERGGVVEPALDEEGNLELRDRRDISGRYFDTYVIEVEEGQSLTVDMISEEFDAYLFVWDPSGDAIHQDDDNGGDTDARISVSDAAEGRWTIYATSSSAAETGAYRVRAISY